MSRLVRNYPKVAPAPIEWAHRVDSVKRGDQVRNLNVWTLTIGPEWSKTKIHIELESGFCSWKFGAPNGFSLASGSCSSLEVAQRDALDAAIRHVRSVLSEHREVLGALGASRKSLKESP